MSDSTWRPIIDDLLQPKQLGTALQYTKLHWPVLQSQAQTKDCVEARKEVRKRIVTRARGQIKKGVVYVIASSVRSRILQ